MSCWRAQHLFESHLSTSGFFLPLLRWFAFGFHPKGLFDKPFTLGLSWDILDWLVFLTLNYPSQLEIFFSTNCCVMLYQCEFWYRVVAPESPDLWIFRLFLVPFRQNLGPIVWFDGHDVCFICINQMQPCLTPIFILNESVRQSSVESLYKFFMMLIILHSYIGISKIWSVQEWPDLKPTLILFRMTRLIITLSGIDSNVTPRSFCILAYQLSCTMRWELFFFKSIDLNQIY